MTVTIGCAVPTSPTAFGSFTTAQNVTSTPIEVLANAIPTSPGYYPGSTATYSNPYLHVVAGGVFSTTGTPTCIAGVTALQAGTATTMAANASFTTATGASNLSWHLDCYLGFSLEGSIGQVTSTGFVRFASSASASTVVPIPTTTPQTQVLYNCAEPGLWSIYWTWGTSSASNTVAVNYMIVELG